MKNWKLAVALVLVALAHGGCAMLDYSPPAPPARTDPPVPPIRNNSLVISVSLDATYNLVDLLGGRDFVKSDTVAYLNELGQADGNTFAEQNGNSVNFYYSFTIHNDDQDHYTGSLEFSGWGQGHLCAFHTEYAYADPKKMFRDLLAQSYVFIHNGWRDPRVPNQAPSWD